MRKEISHNKGAIPMDNGILLQLNEINKRLDETNRQLVLFIEKTNAIYQAFINYFEVMGQLNESKNMVSMKRAC